MREFLSRLTSPKKNKSGAIPSTDFFVHSVLSKLYNLLTFGACYELLLDTVEELQSSSPRSMQKM